MRYVGVGLVLWLVAGPAGSALQVFACEPEWGSLSKALGGERVAVYTATTAQQDPHNIQARPSLVARARQADLITCTGADLETGWLPLLLRQSGNNRIQPGKPGHFLAAEQVELLEVPEQVDRSMGDVHPAGNPHVHLDPRRLLIIAAALRERLAALDPHGADDYQARFDDFEARWHQAMTRWRDRAAPLEGIAVVTHHKDWVYLFDWLGITNAGQLEPKPGLPPSAGHLSRLKAAVADGAVAMILRTPYQDPRPANWLAEQTGLPVVAPPYTVGGTSEVEDLFDLFRDTIERLLAAYQ